MHEQKRHRFADDVAAAENDGVCAFDGDVVAAKNFHAASGSAGDEAFAAADEFAETDGMKSVHVFRGIDSFENGFCVDLLWERKLDEDAVDIVVAIQIVNEFQEFAGGDGSGGSVQPTGEAELFAGGDFAFDVKLRGRIFADEDSGKTGANALCGKASDFLFEFDENLVADFESIEDACSHAALTFRKRNRKNITRKVADFSDQRPVASCDSRWGSVENSEDPHPGCFLQECARG